jgi:hypothetical protein
MDVTDPDVHVHISITHSYSCYSCYSSFSCSGEDLDASLDTRVELPFSPAPSAYGLNRSATMAGMWIDKLWTWLWLFGLGLLSRIHQLYRLQTTTLGMNLVSVSSTCWCISMMKDNACVLNVFEWILILMNADLNWIWTSFNWMELNPIYWHLS